MNVDVKNLGPSLAAQFQGLSGHPGLWPILPRLLCALGVLAGVVTLAYFGYWSSQFEDEDKGAQQEVNLRADYKTKIEAAINLEGLRSQKVQVDQYVERLQKQLPSKAEMAALLSDINQAGVGRGLQFDLFKPNSVVVKDYYAELPIDIEVSGTYHDIGAFAADMAHLPRIVTLNNMAVSAGKDGGNLVLKATAKTFRYLDPDEVSAQRKAAAKDKAGKKTDGASK